MSHELHYTSAPRGLKPGSRGFATVACTAGLSPSLAERLEALSGYRQVFPPHHGRATDNPVAWSHLVVSISGRAYHIVSRVGAAGLDYSDRANKYAHHVALEPAERPAGGPAWLVRQPGYLDSAWAGDPRVLPAARPTPRGDRVAAPCAAWRAAAGDAGWAGVVAQAFLDDPKRAVYLVYEPGTDLLPLIDEALGLLPPSRRWEVTFSTYFTSLPPETQCQWRGVLLDSAEARQAGRIPNALVLDLTRQLGPAPDGPLVEAARTGILPPTLDPPLAPTLVPAGPESDPYVPPVYADRYRPDSDPEPDPIPDAEFRVIPDLPADPRPQALSRVLHGTPDRQNRTLLIAATVGAVLLALGSGALWYLNQPRLGSTPPLAQASNTPAPAVKTPTPTAPAPRPAASPAPAPAVVAATNPAAPTAMVPPPPMPMLSPEANEATVLPVKQKSDVQISAETASPPVEPGRKPLTIDITSKQVSLPLTNAVDAQFGSFWIVNASSEIKTFTVLGASDPSCKQFEWDFSSDPHGPIKTAIIRPQANVGEKQSDSNPVAMLWASEKQFGFRLLNRPIRLESPLTEAARDLVVRLDLSDNTTEFVFFRNLPVKSRPIEMRGFFKLVARVGDKGKASADYEVQYDSTNSQVSRTSRSVRIQSASIDSSAGELIRFEPDNDKGQGLFHRAKLPGIELRLNAEFTGPDDARAAILRLNATPSPAAIAYKKRENDAYNRLSERAKEISGMIAARQGDCIQAIDSLLKQDLFTALPKAKEVKKILNRANKYDESKKLHFYDFQEAQLEVDKVVSYCEDRISENGGMSNVDLAFKTLSELSGATLNARLVRDIGGETFVIYEIGDQ